MSNVNRNRRDEGVLLNPPKLSKCNEKKVLPDAGSQKVMFPGHKDEAGVTEWSIRRREVKEAVYLYRENLYKFSRERRKKCKDGTHWSDHLMAAKLLGKQGRWVNRSKQFGHVPGIRIGDEFLWRAELKIVGLHHQLINGIDYMRLPNEKILATSIVDSGRYANGVGSFNTLVYCGQGENPNVQTGNGKLKDQKLERGNLALKNNMEAKVPVRVIRKYKKNSVGCASMGARTMKKTEGYKYVYDGLYFVDSLWKERGSFGKMVFKFLLKRIPGQLDLNWRKL
ncbi:hypothetical protein SLEP1_g33880 [Rubroshorea leprosula]|uniref:YDG domain-containing protein n=1 Tax=Rubroshorea leprosula TaxID=152421 RepID=A0AAV5KI20_9ROSI|nr:hypothetical protein SLEP1_g33880 [Rubroshorea leprosula]